MTKPKAKPPGVYADHVRYGRGRILAVHKLDNTTLAADMKFDDGSERTLMLAQEYWLSNIKALKVTPPKAPRAKKVAAVEALVD